MSNAMSIHRDYLFDLGLELNQLARQARHEREAAPEESRDRILNEGCLALKR